MYLSKKLEWKGFESTGMKWGERESQQGGGKELVGEMTGEKGERRKREREKGRWEERPQLPVPPSKKYYIVVKLQDLQFVCILYCYGG